MAHSLSAKKRVRQNLTHRLRNRRTLLKLRGSMKAFLTDVAHGQTEEATKKLSGLYKIVDQTVAKGAIHSNAGARYKSRLNRRLTAARTKTA